MRVLKAGLMIFFLFLITVSLTTVVFASQKDSIMFPTKKMDNSRGAKAGNYGEGGYSADPGRGGLDITSLYTLTPGSNSRVDNQYPNVAILTMDIDNQKGAMYARKKVNVSKEFHIDADVYIGPGRNSLGVGTADGMTFVLQNDSRGTNAFGEVGQDLGYQSPSGTGTRIQNSVNMEMDTYFNGDKDHDYDMELLSSIGRFPHIAWQIPSGLKHHINPVSVFNLYDYSWRPFHVDYVPNGAGGATVTGSITTATGVKSSSYVIPSITAAFGTTGEVFWGLVGSTGLGHEVAALKINEIIPSAKIMATKYVYDDSGKDIDNGGVTAGQKIKYKISATNQGTDSGKSMTFSDALPAGVNLVGNTGTLTDQNGNKTTVPLTVNGRNISYSYASNNASIIDIGKTVSLDFDVTINGAEQTILNTADVITDYITDKTNTVTNYLNKKESKITVLKNVFDENGKDINNGNVSLNQKLTYQLTVKNDGDAASNLLMFQDTLPAGVDLASPTAKLIDQNGNETNVTLTVSGQTISYTYYSNSNSLLDPGKSVKLKFDVKVNGKQQDVVNKAQVTDGTSNDTKNSNEVTNHLKNESKITVLKNVFDENDKDINNSNVSLNQKLTYQLTVKNDGDTSSKLLMFQDILPAGVDLASPTAKLIDQNGNETNVVLTVSGQTISYAYYSNSNSLLDPGKSVKLKFDVKVNGKQQDMVNKAQVIDGTNNDTKDSNEVTNHLEKQESKSSAKKSVFDETGKDIDGENVTDGQQITYRLTGKNIGTGAAKKVVFEDTLPTGVMLKSDKATLTKQDGSKNQVTMNVSGQKISYTYSDSTNDVLAAGKSVSLDFEVQINGQQQTIINTGSITMDNSQDISNSVTNKLVKLTTDIDVQKSVFDENNQDINGAEVKLDQVLTYELTVKNTGNKDIETIVFVDSLPTGVTLATTDAKLIDQNGQETSVQLNNISGTINYIYSLKALGTKDVLAVGKSAKLRIKVKVNGQALTMTNKANITADGIAKDTNEVVNTMAKELEIETTKSVFDSAGNDINGANVTDQQVLTYKIKVKNTGNTNSAITEITDTMPKGAVPIDSTARWEKSDGSASQLAKYTYDKSTRVLTTDTNGIEAGDNKTFIVDVMVNTADVEDAKLINTAHAVIRKAGAVAEDDTNEVVNTVAKKLGIETTKSVLDSAGNDINGANVTNQQVLTYKIKVKNTGNANGVITEITDTMPKGAVPIDSTARWEKSDGSASQLAKYTYDKSTRVLTTNTNGTEAGDSKTFIVDVTVNAADVEDAKLINTAHALIRRAGAPAVEDDTNEVVNYLKEENKKITLRYVDLDENLTSPGQAPTQIAPEESAEGASGEVFSKYVSGQVAPKEIDGYTIYSVTEDSDLTTANWNAAYKDDPMFDKNDRIITYGYKKAMLTMEAPKSWYFGRFDTNQIDRTYYLDSKGKPQAVTVTDNYGVQNWELKVSQNYQLKDDRNHELTGAQLQFSNGEVKAVANTNAGTVNTNITAFTVDPGQPAQTLMTMQKNGTFQTDNPDTSNASNPYTQVGEGVWQYQFGDDKTADYSIGLHVPATTKRYRTKYTTELTWSLTVAP